MMHAMQADLFAPPPPAPPVTMHRGALHEVHMEPVREALGLHQAHTTMYGRRVPVPRLEAWYGTRPYAYGGQVQQPQPWPPALLSLRARVAELVGEPFDSCFANYYRTGEDHISWHADDEAWIGPTIASVTLGGARRFVMRHRASGHVVEYVLGHGDVLVMRAPCQAEWLHHVPPTAKHVRPRLNLTFRQTVEE